MKLYLQLGYGMMALCAEISAARPGTTTILSPRDLTPAQLIKLTKKFHASGGSVVVDPQFYLPRADHNRLISHAYWPQQYETQEFWSESGAQRLVSEVMQLNRILGSTQTILPGEFATAVDDDWLYRQSTLIECAQKLDICDASVSTIAI